MNEEVLIKMKLLIIFEFKRTTFRSEVQFTFVTTGR